MKTGLFSNKGRIVGSAQATPLDQVVDALRVELNQRGHQFASPSVARSAMSMESMDKAVEMEVANSVDGLSAALESIASTHGKGFAKFTEAQMAAATVAGIIASDVKTFLQSAITHNVVATESMGFVAASGGDVTPERMREALEAYDERDNKNAAVYSVAYNMQAARQDEFGETFFPTVVVTPDQVGYSVSIRLIQVYNEYRRQISGNLDKVNKRNIIQAVIDPTILKNDLMKVIPVLRAQSTQWFVDPALVAPYNYITEDNQAVATAPLAMGKSFSLIALSQTDDMLATGLQDTTDSLDTSLALAALYMRVQGTVAGAAVNEVFKFNTLRLPTAVMNYSVQGNYRQMSLAFTSDSLLVSPSTTLVNGAASQLLAPLAAGNFNVKLSVRVSGTVNLELGDTTLFTSDVSVASVTDATGNLLDLTTGTGLAIAQLFTGSQMFGYDLDARRTNLNRRMRGQLLDTTYYNQVYAVPLRSPITVPRPLTIGDANDSTDLAALITATHIRTSNAAVAELLSVESYLRDYVGSNQARLLGTPAPEILGVSRFLVEPFYEHFALDVSAAIDSLKSHERAADIQATLVNKLRDMAYRMYRDSGYQAAADALAGGIAPMPTVIIGTDPVISRYLTVAGDFRTLGNDFNVKVVSTLNRDMAGKILMTFGVFDQGMEGVPNPMHFGNMAWKPELTLVLPLHRNGANSKELTVQPSFMHVTNLPILASIDVTGIQQVSQVKVPVNMHTV